MRRKGVAARLTGETGLLKSVGDMGMAVLVETKVLGLLCSLPKDVTG